MNTLYIIPNFLSQSPFEDCFPKINSEIIKELGVFVVESRKYAIRLLKKACPEMDIDALQFIEINKHYSFSDRIMDFEKAIRNQNVGLISDAGMPVIADPGSETLLHAHKLGAKVISLIGPSSIFLALAASGLQAQNFHFHGYLPVKEDLLQNTLKQVKQEIDLGCTSVFIEAPHRNDKLLSQLIKHFPPHFYLCLAKDITGHSEFIKTKTLAEWKKAKDLKLHKIPCVFVLGNPGK